MNIPRISFLFVFVALQLAAAEFTVRIVDGLGRPVPAVNVEVYCDSKTAELRPLQFMSDQNGAIHGTYDDGMCKPASVSIEKQGYQGYLTGFRDRYILQRVLSEPDLPRIARLPGDELEQELSEALAGAPSSYRKFADSIFYYEAQLRPALWDLARHPELTLRVRQTLSMIAAPDDLHLIMRLDPPPAAGAFGDRWRYQVATSLVNPDSEEEWSFLRRCAFNEFDDRWADAGAIQTLKLTASQRSQTILEEAKKANPTRAAQIEKALAYIRANPIALANADLEALGKAVAQVVTIGNWGGNGAPRFNQAGDKALIDFTFQTAEDRYGYTATFHRAEGLWTLRGVHESYQAFAANAVVK